MRDEDAFCRDIGEKQRAMFRLFVGQGQHIGYAALSAATAIDGSDPIPKTTLQSYAAGVTMPLTAVLKLSRVLPAEAINMLTERAGKRLVDAEATDTNWDLVAAEAADLVSEVCTARIDGIIDHVEDARLRAKTRKLIADAQGAIGV